MNRSQAIANIKAYAAAGDAKACFRIYCEARISRAVYEQAVTDGRSLAAFVAKRDAEKASA